MNSHCHTVILKIGRCPLPREEELREMVSESLASKKSELEYFGCELDSGWDYVDEHLKTQLLKACFITFQFEDPNAPPYGTAKETVQKYMVKLFAEHSSTIVVDSMGKDIDVYFD